MKKTFAAILCTAIATGALAIDVTTVRTAGPYVVKSPFMLDSVNAAQTKFSAEELMKTPISFDELKQGKKVSVASLSKAEKGAASQLMLAGFDFSTSSYVNAEVKVEGAKSYEIFIDGKKQSGKSGFQPGQYNVVVKYVPDTAQLKLSVSADNEKALAIVDAVNGKRQFSLADNMLLKHYNGISVSPSGKYAIVSSSRFDTYGKTQYDVRVVEVATNRTIFKSQNRMGWMPKSDKFQRIVRDGNKSKIVVTDPQTLKETTLCADLPVDNYTISPTEDYLILSKYIEGPKKEDGVYEVLSPNDRQPGWRTRSQLLKMDLKSGLVQPLTYGYNPVYLYDISRDGKTIIFGVQEERLTKRPTTLMTFYKMNLQSLESEKIIEKDGFIANVSFIPGTNKLAVIGGPEAFDGVGKNLPDSLIPNSYDHQLFVFDLDTKKANPVTRSFNPSIEDFAVNGDGMVYFSAQNADSVSLYKLNVKTNRIDKVAQPCEVIGGLSLANYAGTMLYYGTGACTSDRLYALDTKKLKVSELENLNAERLSDVEIGNCEGFCFKSKNGYDLTGHYYLPANFDATKKYPMIVHYYGGCSPTARRFGGGTHYPAHYWNALGYVVLIVNPSGASGFGQEWGSRHVNTMGEGVAEDIIEATEWFADNNSFVNRKKIGCVSASYGGFMTQLLLSKTDLFATGISHAGISDHTSYWGEGYWGFSYSEVSAANTYPRTRKDLYVDRSPLYNADKIHNPILFTHGTADTNVPIGESIQMYTALKLLGVPTAFVMVEGENHGIMDYTKRQKWINTMMAWFQKYLQDDDSWWNAIYTPKKL